MSKPGTLENYFTPVRDTPKRRRSNSTPPECSKKQLIKEMSPSKKIGDFTPDEFSKMIELTMDKKLQNVATKEDIAVIKGAIDSVVEENCRLKEEVAQLKHDTRVLKDQVNESRNLLTRNKLIIRGLKVPVGTSLVNAVLDLVVNVLKVANVNIVQTFILGKPSTNKPGLILVEFATYKDVIEIYKNVSKLKGTGL
uniref:Putative helicase/primase complex protein n=1 Tax=Lygus hesperus TaxID=30085 RepID=A0A0A9Z029_LYGHE